jgi:hypothetical protein
VVVVASVGEVEARHAHTGAEQLLNDGDTAAHGAERAHDLTQKNKNVSGSEVW